jgi:hypothetical protein
MDCAKVTNGVDGYIAPFIAFMPSTRSNIVRLTGVADGDGRCLEV